MPNDSLLIISNSGRMLGSMAKRAGYHVIIIDFFADQDSRQLADFVVKSAHQNYQFTHELIGLVKQIIIAYPKLNIITGSGFESQPKLLDQLKTIATHIGNSTQVVSLITSIKSFTSLLDQLNLNYPKTEFLAPNSTQHWLAKMNGGSGGWLVHDWQGNTQADYYQQYCQGRVMGVVFIGCASGDQHYAIIVGYHKQWQTGVEAYHYRYGGAIICDDIEAKVATKVAKAVNDIVSACGLLGLCGMDFILSPDDEVIILEINPRPPISAELYDHDGTLLTAHYRACQRQPVNYQTSLLHITAHVVIYAHADMFLSSHFDWLPWVKDKPVANTYIKTQQPICTIWAESPSSQQTKKLLNQRVDKMKQDLEICLM